jgi:type VI secretion system protein ImpH
MGGMPSRGGAAGRHGTADDLLTRCLYCLLGLGTDRLRGRLEFDDEAFLFYAGHFAHRPRSALALESVLADYFELPLQIKQFLGQWLYLRESDQSALPSPRRPRGLNTQLGVNVVAGERVWGIQSKFRARFGPLGYREFCRFLPSGDALRPVCQMIRCYVGPEYDFDVQPVLKAEEVPWCCLGGDGDSPARLGWNTWIRSRTLRQDVSDAVFSLEGLPWTT